MTARSPSRNGRAMRRGPGSTPPRSIDADGEPSASAMRRAVWARPSSSASSSSSTRAISAARSASRRRAWASAARLRATSEIALVTIATTRKVLSATQFSLCAIVKRPVGGMWNQLKAAALSRAAPMPSPIPQVVAATSTTRR